MSGRATTSVLKSVNAVLTTAAMVVYLVAPLATLVPQATIAASPTYYISLTSQTIAPFAISLTGTASANPYVGQLSAQHVRVLNWGDGSAQTEASFTVTNSTDNPKTFTADWSATHTYATVGTYTITVAVCHTQCTGAEGADGSITVNAVIPPATLNVIKHVINTGGGTKIASDFTIHVSGTGVSPSTFSGVESPGTTVSLDAGAYSISEDVVANYVDTYSTDCSGSIVSGQTKTCTVTNTFSTTPPPPPPTPECSDDLDNDLDSLTDESDPACHTDGDVNNSGSYDGDLDDESNNPSTQCGDGLDNDEDGAIDLADEGCESLEDDDENQPPVISLNGLNPFNLILGIDVYSEPGATADDAEDGPGLEVTDITGSVNSFLVGIYEVFYNFIDLGGLSATQVIRTVNVNPGETECSDNVTNDNDGEIDYPADSGCLSYSDNSENQPPVITVTGDNPLELVVNVDSYSEQGATADDPEGGSGLTVTDINSSAVNTSIVGPYLVSYNFTDLDGAPATEAFRTVNVVSGDNECNNQVDDDGDGNIDTSDSGCEDVNDTSENTPPDVIIDTEIIMLTLHGVFSPPTGVHATDIEDESISVDVLDNPVNVDLAGDYIVTYGATDSNGASAETETQVVKVRTECADTFNNDEEDDLIDENDPGCWTDPNDSETYNPADEDETTPADVCSNIDGIQTEVPEGLILDGDMCVVPPPPPPPEDTTPPVSHFDNQELLNNHPVIETEMIPLSLLGGRSEDDLSGILPDAEHVTLAAYKIDSFFDIFVELDCSRISEPQIPIEIVALDLVSVNPLQVTWTPQHDLVPSSGTGVYCFVAHATDNAGNLEQTAVGGPVAYNPTSTPPPPPPPPPPPTPPPPTGGGNGPIEPIFTPSGGGTPPGNGPISTPAPVVTPAPAGEVLGAVTSCSVEYLSEYIKSGRQNNPVQVLKLQQFLNEHLGLNLPLTGFYGPMTLAAVNQFQTQYGDEVLAPWIPYGHPDKNTPTGYVYKTTRRWINMLSCPALGLPIPPLP